MTEKTVLVTKLLRLAACPAASPAEAHLSACRARDIAATHQLHGHLRAKCLVAVRKASRRLKNGKVSNGLSLV